MSQRALHTLTLSLLVLCVAQGCGYVRRTRTPMPSLAFEPILGPRNARGAIVLLPGFGDRPSTFEARGFVAALREAAPGYDLYAADAHFGYYRTNTLITRLEADVIGPLRTSGYAELWIAGASMGGHGAVGYAREHPEGITGLMLFAPYMGPREVVAEVRSAGGLCGYRTGPVQPRDAEGFARANFAWLRNEACESKKVSLWLAVGASDHLLSADRLLGDALDPSHVLVVPGGHGWKVWTPAVARLAPQALIGKAAAAVGGREGKGRQSAM